VSRPAADVSEAVRAAFTPRAVMPFPDWADANIVLDRGGVRTPWRTSLTPYLRQPMLDASVESPVEEIVIMKPSQWGASECFAVAFPCYMADVAPCNILEIQPDLEAAARFSQLRIDPVIAGNPRLRALFVEKKSRDAGNTQHLKTFPGGSWAILGSNSPAGLSSLPAAVVIFDERSSLGLVRLRVKKASQELGDVFARIMAKVERERSAAGAAFESPFAEITDEDIDALFSE